MNNVGNSFSLPFKSANWLSTFLVMGLISLIPIVGALAMTGWMLTLLDNYRQGRTDLPPAGFQHIGRGVQVFVVQLVYGLVLAVLLVGPFIFFIFVDAAAGAGNGTGNSAARSAAVAPFAALSPLWFAGFSLLSLVIYFFMAPVVVNTERGGIGAGLNPALLWATASRHWGNTLLGGVLIFVAYFIGQLGIYACCIGYLVSLPYAYAVVAGVIRYYEATFEPSQSGPPAAAAVY